MENENRLAWPRYVLAAVFVLAAALIRLALMPLLASEDGGFLIYLSAVIACSAIGGSGLGFLAMLVLAALSIPYIVGPDGTLFTASRQNITQLILFLVGTSLMLLFTNKHRQKQRSTTTREELSRFVQSALDAIMVVDTEGRIRQINRTGQRVFNITKSVATRTPITGLIPDWSLHIRHAEIGPDGADPCSVFYGVTGHRNGGDFPIEVSIAPTQCVDGKVYIVIIRDTTQRKQDEAERLTLLKNEQEAREMAERATRMKDEFLAVVSHELRTPLNAIMGWSDMVRRPGITPELLTTAMESIHRNSRIQAQLIEDILDVSRIVSGKLRLNLRNANLKTVVGMAIESVKHSADAKSISIREFYDDALIPCVIDPDRIQQVVWNLVCNAVKFTPERGRITVRVLRENRQILLEVSDTGEGISADFLPFLFDRFRQADSSISRKHNGLGLGLAISRHLIEMHGGSIKAESPGANQGSRFTVRFPLQEPVPAVPSLNEGTAGTESITGLRLLVVDDEADQRTLLDNLLKSHAAEVCITASGAEARHALDWFKPDILIADISMPDEDGIQFIQKVRDGAGDAKMVPAIALTANTRKEDRERILDAGYNLFVPKPFNTPDLLRAIKSLNPKPGALAPIAKGA